MAEAPKKKRASFTRTQKPLFAVVRVSDGQGGYYNVTADQIEITVERDAGKLLELVTAGNVTGAVVKIHLPAAPARAKSDASA